MQIHRVTVTPTLCYLSDAEIADGRTATIMSSFTKELEVTGNAIG